MQDVSLPAVTEREWKPISRNDTNLDMFMNTVFWGMKQQQQQQ